jgi:hypothetical protein
MKTQSIDTDPRVEARWIEGLRAMTSSQKLASVRAGNRAVQKLQLADIKRRYPTATERELRLRLASRSLDASTMRRVFGWDPELEGR